MQVRLDVALLLQISLLCFVYHLSSGYRFIRALFSLRTGACSFKDLHFLQNLTQFGSDTTRSIDADLVKKKRYSSLIEIYDNRCSHFFISLFQIRFLIWALLNFSCFVSSGFNVYWNFWRKCTYKDLALYNKHFCLILWSFTVSTGDGIVFNTVSVSWTNIFGKIGGLKARFTAPRKLLKNNNKTNKTSKKGRWKHK